MTHAQTILDFWFKEITPQQWWKKDPEFDQNIAKRFGATLEQARACELYTWRKSAKGRLAEIIVLDQFSRNIHRDTPMAFSADSLALALAQEAVALGLDLKLEEQERPFLYMPYMHSESLEIHKEAQKLFAEKAPQNLEFEEMHLRIIQRFGRYPHRNSILGRESTPEEIAFLKTPNSSF